MPAVVPLKMPRQILRNFERPELSALIAPLLHSDKCLGVLAMTCGTRMFTEELFPYAKAVGTQIAQVLGMIHVLGIPQEKTMTGRHAG